MTHASDQPFSFKLMRGRKHINMDSISTERDRDRDRGTWPYGGEGSGVGYVLAG